MAANLQELEVAVQKTQEVQASAIVLIQGIAAALEEAKADPTKIAALAQQLRDSADTLGAAVATYTPSTPV